MDEKKLVYEIILSIWNLAKEFGFKKLSDNEWVAFIDKAQILRGRFKTQGNSFDLLFRDMFAALQSYYERKKNSG